MTRQPMPGAASAADPIFLEVFWTRVRAVLHRPHCRSAQSVPTVAWPHISISWPGTKKRSRHKWSSRTVGTTKDDSWP